MKKFYAYTHSRPDGTPFYVGKGTGIRSHVFSSGRNSYHQNVVAKYGPENIRIHVYPCESEQEAFDLEVSMIKALRVAGIRICNLTAGGEGMSGYVPAEVTRAKIGAASKSAHARRTPAERALLSAKLSTTTAAVQRGRSAEEKRSFYEKLRLAQQSRSPAEKAALKKTISEVHRSRTDEQRASYSAALSAGHQRRDPQASAARNAAISAAQQSRSDEEKKLFSAKISAAQKRRTPAENAARSAKLSASLKAYFAAKKAALKVE